MIATHNYPMKIRTVLLLLSAALPAFAGDTPPGLSAPAPAPASSPKPELPPGMRRYYLVLLIRTPKWGEGTAEARKADFAGHFANMKRMALARKLVLAGPFGQGADNDGSHAGLFLMTVDTVGEVRAELEQDPTIRHGRFAPKILEWYGAEGVTTPELERTLAEAAAGSAPAPPPASAPTP